MVSGSSEICRGFTEMDEEKEISTLKGILATGEGYYVCRVMLPCNDFNAQILLFLKRSASGCYLLPVDLPFLP